MRHIILLNKKGETTTYRANFWTPGVVDYSDVGEGRALLRKETMDKMLPSFVGKPVVIDHVEAQPEEIFNSGQAVGRVTEAKWNPDTGWYEAEFTVTDTKAKELIEGGISVSCAFNVLDAGPGGEYLAVKYNEEVTDGSFTHLALVENPRYEDSKIFKNSKRMFLNSKGAKAVVKENSALSSVNVDILDALEQRMVKDMMSRGMTKEQAIQIVINNAEGDKSQLSPQLQKFANSKENSAAKIADHKGVSIFEEADGFFSAPSRNLYGYTSIEKIQKALDEGKSWTEGSPSVKKQNSSTDPDIEALRMNGWKPSTPEQLSRAVAKVPELLKTMGFDALGEEAKDPTKAIRALEEVLKSQNVSRPEHKMIAKAAIDALRREGMNSKENAIGGFDNPPKIGDVVTFSAGRFQDTKGKVIAMGTQGNNYTVQMDDGTKAIVFPSQITYPNSKENSGDGRTTSDGKTLDDVSMMVTGKKYRQLPDDGSAQEHVMAEFEKMGGVAQKAFNSVQSNDKKNNGILRVSKKNCSDTNAGKLKMFGWFKSKKNAVEDEAKKKAQDEAALKAQEAAKDMKENGEQVNLAEQMVDIDGEQVSLADLIKTYQAEQAEKAVMAENATEEKVLSPEDPIADEAGNVYKVGDLLNAYQNKKARMNAEAEEKAKKDKEAADAEAKKNGQETPEEKAAREAKENETHEEKELRIKKENEKEAYLNGLDFGDGKTEAEARAKLKEMGYTDAEVEETIATKKAGASKTNSKGAKKDIKFFKKLNSLKDSATEIRENGIDTLKDKIARGKMKYGSKKK